MALLLGGVGLMMLDVRMRRLGLLHGGWGWSRSPLGSVLAWKGVAPAIEISPWLIGGAVVASLLYYGFGLTVAIQSRDRIVNTQQGLIGLVGEARGDLAPEGPVYVKGAMWRGTDRRRRDRRRAPGAGPRGRRPGPAGGGRPGRSRPSPEPVDGCRRPGLRSWRSVTEPLHRRGESRSPVSNNPVEMQNDLGHRGWQHLAACRGEDSTYFFAPNYFEKRAEKNAREAVAKAICVRCPVRDDCLEYALERP